MKMRPLLNNPDEVNDPPRPFFEHIVALRSCLMNSALAWLACSVVAGVVSPKILSMLQLPIMELEKAGKLSITSLNLTGGFAQIMSIAMWGGVALAFPLILYFVLRFIFPALTKREKFAILFFLIAGAFCFMGGVWLAYAQLAPNVVAFFDLVNKWVGLSVTQIQVETYVPLILKLLLGFGMVFQIPLILFVLGWLGIITSETLCKYRRFAIVIAFFLGMVLTPPDIMSQLMMAIPLCLLYEVCILLIKLKEFCTLSNSSSSDKNSSTVKAESKKASEKKSSKNTKKKKKK